MLDSLQAHAVTTYQFFDGRGRPVRIQFTDCKVTKYVYSTAGEKLRVTHLTAVPNITVPIGSARELLPSEILSANSTDYLLGGEPHAEERVRRQTPVFLPETLFLAKTVKK